jgi:hypothetical protein
MDRDYGGWRRTCAGARQRQVPVRGGGKVVSFRRHASGLGSTGVGRIGGDENARCAGESSSGLRCLGLGGILRLDKTGWIRIHDRPPTARLRICAPASVNCNRRAGAGPRKASTWTGRHARPWFVRSVAASRRSATKSGSAWRNRTSEVRRTTDLRDRYRKVTLGHGQLGRTLPGIERLVGGEQLSDWYSALCRELTGG